ncbi:nucleotide-binding protein [Desulfolutivibrio sp.]|uniref:nucleotide-binding protein n=1 Tax=Desulfolutivibrio sp. TaxID=2773296 RepID=UPI002F9611E1
MSTTNYRQNNVKQKPTLCINRVKAQILLRELIDIGNKLINDISEYRPTSTVKVIPRRFVDRYARWNLYNTETLAEIFTDNEISQIYSNKYSSIYSSMKHEIPEILSTSLVSMIESETTYIVSIIERLHLFSENNKRNTNQNNSDSDSNSNSNRVVNHDKHTLKSNKIFIAHGHDDARREELARFIEKINLEAIILHEMPNQGKTIIEKFEAHSDVSFAIIILSPDDCGCKKDDRDNYKLRARQNVIFELGYFFSKLGRNRVAALIIGDIEKPSDVDGIVYIPYDASGAWKFKIAHELQSSGLDIDLNKIRESNMKKK